MKSIKIISFLIIFVLILFLSPVLRAENAKSLQFVKVETNSKLQIVSKTMLYDQKTNNTEFTGNVILTYGDLKLMAMNLKIKYENQSDIESPKLEFFASGDVVIQNNKQKVTGDEAYFNKQNEEIILTGNVVYSQENSLITGQRLVIDLKDGTASITGPVTTTFAPRKN